MIRDESPSPPTRSDEPANPGVLEAARAIMAGRRVDWAAIESRGDLTESLAGLLDELKVVEGIAELHRSLPEPTGASTDQIRIAQDAVEPAVPASGGLVWGPLRLLERIGQGAFGDVYRAWDPRLDREVALKLLRRPDSHHDSVGSLVVDEGRLLARVRHPNVVTVYGADRIDGRVGLWMEFVRGRTIEVALSEGGPFGAQEAALIGLDVCRALSAVHRAGLIHRDIKAHNVMREAGGRIVLMDFGTGREDLADRHAELAGTPLYLAPEVFAGAPATARSDIYSVGVLLFHLVTGSYPVHGTNLGDIRDAHLRGRRRWLRDERPDLPDRFVQAVERAVEVDAGLRYESAGAFEAALSRFLSASESDGPSRLERPPATRAWVTRFRRPPKLFIASAALVAAVVAVVVSTVGRTAMPGSRDAPPSPQTTAAEAGDSPAVVRRVPLPADYMLVGAPSRDGKLLSMVDSGGNVAVMDLGTAQVRRVTTDAVLDKDSQFAEFTAISPDDGLVAYAWKALDGRWELRVIDMAGKRPRVLIRSDSLEYPIPIEWSHDGKSVLVCLERTDHSHQLAFVSAQDASVHVVKETGTSRPEYASVSPAGDFVAYDLPQQSSSTARDIFIVRADGSDDRRLIEHPANDANPVWSPDGHRLLFVSDRSGTPDVWTIDVVGGVATGEPRVVHRNMGRMWLRGLTDTGGYFYYVTVGAVDVYQAEIGASGVSPPVAIAPSHSGSNISSIWSPDGRRLAYTSRRETITFDRGSTTLAIRDVQTGEQHEFVPALKGFILRSWSPDGRFVVANGTDVSGAQGVFLIDVGDGRVTPVATGGDYARPEWLGDGRILYLNRTSGVLVARTIETGGEEVNENLRAEGINPTGDVNGRGLRVSPDGQTLAFTSTTRSGESSTRVVAVKPFGNGGAVRELARATTPQVIQFQDWMPDGASILFTRWLAKRGEPATLWRVSIHGGEPQPLGLSTVGLRDVSVHPEGRRITFTAGWPTNELWVMENFLSDK